MFTSCGRDAGDLLNPIKVLNKLKFLVSALICMSVLSQPIWTSFQVSPSLTRFHTIPEKKTGTKQKKYPCRMAKKI